MLAYAENPLFQCRFRWTENAIALWDNRCTWHRAMWDYWPHTSSGTRVTVKGERPILVETDAGVGEGALVALVRLLEHVALRVCRRLLGGAAF